MKSKIRLLVSLVLLILASCGQLPAAGPQGADTSGGFGSDPQPTAVPTEANPRPATLNRSDPNSIVAWVQYALEAKDPQAIMQMLQGDRFGYAFYIEGGQSVTRQEFEADLSTRLNSRAPSCKGYFINEYSLAVWVEGWSPAWEMTESCFIECDKLDPPYTSTTTGFLFGNTKGPWELAALYLNTPERYYFEDVPLVACDQTYQQSSLESFGSSASSCPGAPQQRLEIGSQAYVCTSGDNVIMRTDADRGADAMHRYPPGTVLDVVAGPACADGWSWWQVRDEDGLVGWMSEGGSSTNPYFLCPTP